MTKRLVDIDDELLEAVTAILGEPTMKATVNRALQTCVDLEVRRRHAERLLTMDGLDLDDPEAMAGAWR